MLRAERAPHPLFSEKEEGNCSLLIFPAHTLPPCVFSLLAEGEFGRALCRCMVQALAVASHLPQSVLAFIIHKDVIGMGGSGLDSATKLN